MTDHYAVVGNPVAHSKSPQIHSEFARQTGQDIDYVRLLAPLDGFEAAVNGFRGSGGRGVNVTLPFKLQAFRFASRHSTRALRAQAVNTLRFDADGVYGDNTDGAGLVRDLESNLGVAIAGRRVLLMGAGGAARGVLPILLERKPSLLMIANRTPSRACDLQHDASAWGACEASGYSGLTGRRFELVINATSASIGGELPPLPDDLFAAGACAYDMMYGREPTPFLRFAQARGVALAVDGLGMLVEQAAESFLVWRGVRPDTAPVIRLLKQG